MGFIFPTCIVYACSGGAVLHEAREMEQESKTLHYNQMGAEQNSVFQVRKCHEVILLKLGDSSLSDIS